MGQMGEWIHPSTPPSEGYWEALLRDGESGNTAPATSKANLWDEQSAKAAEVSEEPPAIDEQWEEAHRLMEQGEILEVPVVGCNRGGLLVGWNGIRGFVPASHLLNLPQSLDEKQRQEELRRFIGTQLRLKIIELNRERKRFILSERATHIDQGRCDELLDRLQPGDVCQGQVTNLCSFGAFVDLGGFEGLVHISEISWGRVGHPSDILETGQDVEVYVLNVDPERERVGLSLKRLQPDPWRSVEDRYQVGQIIEGTITHVVDFGAFVQVEEGLEGLIHVSELTAGNPSDPHDIIQEGDTVAVQVLNIDGEQRRMGLKLQQVQSSATDEA